MQNAKLFRKKKHSAKNTKNSFVQGLLSTKLYLIFKERNLPFVGKNLAKKTLIFNQILTGNSQQT